MVLNKILYTMDTIVDFIYQPGYRMLKLNTISYEMLVRLYLD